MNVTKLFPALAAAVIVFSTASAQTAKEAGSKGVPPAAGTLTGPEVIIACPQEPLYPFGTDLTNGKTLPTKSVDIIRSGKLIKLETTASIAVFDADPVKYTKKFDDAAIAKQDPQYPFGTSMVTGKPLTATAHKFVHGFKLVKLADAAELTAFNADPAKYMKMLDQKYIDTQKPTYGFTLCPVSLVTLGSKGEPFDYLYGTKLVKFASLADKDAFEKNPEAYKKNLWK